MNKLMIFMAAILLSGAATAQNVIDKHFKKYKEQDNFTTIQVTGKMFELASYIEIEEEDADLQELKDFVSSIEAFNMIVGKEVTESKSKYQSALSKVENSHEELLSVDDKQGKFKFFIDEKNGVVRELVMIGMTPEELMIFSLEGKMDLRKLGKMTQQIQQGGFEEMGMMFEHGVDNVKVYPNPAQANGRFTYEVPSEMIGGTVKVFDINGALIAESDLSERKQSFNTAGYAAGTYVVQFEKDNVRIKKKVIVQSR